METKFGCYLNKLKGTCGRGRKLPGFFCFIPASSSCNCFFSCLSWVFVESICLRLRSQIFHRKCHGERIFPAEGLRKHLGKKAEGTIAYLCLDTWEWVMNIIF